MVILWDKINFLARSNIMNSLGNIKSTRIGVTLTSKILNITEPIEIKYEGFESFPNSAIIAMFIPSNMKILFNNDIIETLDFFEVMAAGIHETRHLYQEIQILLGEESLEDYDRIKLWKYESLNYSEPFISKENIVSKGYLTMDREIDAVAFTHYLLDRTFDVSTIIPELILDKVLLRISEIDELLKLEKVLL
jgi:hypothetical protein